MSARCSSLAKSNITRVCTNECRGVLQKQSASRRPFHEVQIASMDCLSACSDAWRSKHLEGKEKGLHLAALRPEKRALECLTVKCTPVQRFAGKARQGGRDFEARQNRCLEQGARSQKLGYSQRGELSHHYVQENFVSMARSWPPLCQ